MRIWSSFSVPAGDASRIKRSVSEAMTAALLAGVSGEIDSAGFIGAAVGANTSGIAVTGASTSRAAWTASTSSVVGMMSSRPSITNITPTVLRPDQVGRTQTLVTSAETALVQVT